MEKRRCPTCGKQQVYCYRCGKWIDHWHYVWVNGRMLPACTDEILCERRKSRKETERRIQ